MHNLDPTPTLYHLIYTQCLYSRLHQFPNLPPIPTPNRSASPPTIACQFSNLESLKHSVISLGSSSTSSASDGEMSRGSVNATPTGVESPLSPATCLQLVSSHAPSTLVGPAGDAPYVAPLAEKPYTQFVDPRLETNSTAAPVPTPEHPGSATTPFTRQSAPPQLAEVKSVLSSANAKRIKTLLRNSHWSSTNPVGSSGHSSCYANVCKHLFLFPLFQTPTISDNQPA